MNRIVNLLFSPDPNRAAKFFILAGVLLFFISSLVLHRVEKNNQVVDGLYRSECVDVIDGLYKVPSGGGWAMVSFEPDLACFVRRVNR